MKFKKNLLAIAMAGLFASSVFAANDILINEYVKAGVNESTGTFGSGGNTPPGLQYSGAGTGTFNNAYDYLTPGSPFDGFSIKINGTNYANNNAYGLGITGGWTSGTTPGAGSADWTGTFSVGGSLWTVRNLYTLTAGTPYVNITTSITAGSSGTGLWLGRFIDPDARAAAGDSSVTDNVLGYGIIPSRNVAFSEALSSRYALGLYSTDSNVYAGISSWSQEADAYQTSKYGVNYGRGDDTIGLSWNFGDATAGTTYTANYAYIFGPSAFGAASDAITGGAGGGTAGTSPFSGTLTDVGSATSAATSGATGGSSGPTDVTNASGTTTTNPSGTTVLSVTNAGTYTNAGTAGAISNTGTFTNTGTTTTVSNSGTFTNSGTTTAVTNNSTGTFTNNSTGTTGAVTNAGTFSNAGTTSTVTNTGSFTNSGTTTSVTNTSGTFTNTGTTTTVGNSGTFNNNAGGTTGAVTNNSTGNFDNAGTTTTVANDGTFYNTGTTTTVTNTGTFHSSGTTGDVTNSGGFGNYAGGTVGAVTNTGTFGNSGTAGAVTNTTGTFNNYATGVTGTVTNNDTFVNAGTTTTVNNSGTFTNSGTTGAVTNNSTGMFTNTGTTGAITNSGGLTVNNGTTGDITNSGAAAVNNGVTGNISNTGVLAIGGGTVGTVDNTSIFAMSGGTTGNVTNSGTFNYTGGTVSGVTNSGIYNLTGAGANVTVGNYTQTPTGSTVLYWTSAGVQQLAVTGTATLAGDLQLNQQAGTEFRPSYGKHGILTAGTVTGKYDTLTLSPDNVSPLGYKLVYSDTDVKLEVTPSSAYTMNSITQNAGSLSNMNTLKMANLGGGLNYDCAMVGENGLCVSTGARFTTDSAGKIQSGSITIGKKIDKHWRVGVFADKNFGNLTVGNITDKSSNPLIGGFANWNADGDGEGWTVSVAAATASGNLTVNRSGSDYSEAASGNTTTNGYAYQVKTSYTQPITNRTNVSPYIGIRQTKFNTNGYTETGAVYPITYNGISQSKTDVLAGVNVSHDFDDKWSGFVTAGVISNLSNKQGTLSGTSNIIGLQNFSTNLSNPGGTTPVLGAGVSYDVTPNQVIGLSLGWQQQSGIKSGTLTYTVGF